MSSQLPDKFQGFNPDAFRVLSADTRLPHDGKPGKAGALWDAQVRAKKMQMLTLLVQNICMKDVAKMVGISYSAARTYARDPEFLTQLKNLSADVHEKTCREVIDRKVEAHQRILEMSDRALDRLEELLESENENVSLRAVDSVLDRNGDVPKATKSTTVATIIKVDAEMLAVAAQAAREIEGPKFQTRGKIEADNDR